MNEEQYISPEMAILNLDNQKCLISVVIHQRFKGQRKQHL